MFLQRPASANHKDKERLRISMKPRAVEWILDCGCGKGDSLNEEFQLRLSKLEAAEVEMVGVDIDMTSLGRARREHPRFYFVCARGEQLPFRDESFTTVISRVAMPYMDIPLVLREMRRILKVDGGIRIKLHPFSFTMSELSHELRAGSLRQRVQNLVYRAYVIANGLTLHLVGRNFRFPIASCRCESFQTRTGIRRALAAAGFDRIVTDCWATRILWPHAGNCRVSAHRQS